MATNRQHLHALPRRPDVRLSHWLATSAWPQRLELGLRVWPLVGLAAAWLLLQLGSPPTTPS